jgi:uncharacterized protein (DUF433 family)
MVRLAMKTVTVQLPKSLYDIMAERAAARQETPDHYLVELLSEQLLPNHPYVEMVSSRSGPRAVVKDTRVGVDVIVRYMQAGHSAQEIAAEILPHLTLAQVYDALSYYEDHRAIIDEMLQANQPDVWRERLQREMGPAATQLLGE